MKLLLASLLLILALWVGFHLGILSTIDTIQKRYPKAWITMRYEMADKKRADAAREKEAQQWRM